MSDGTPSPGSPPGPPPPRRARARRSVPDAGLLFMLGATLAFPQLGVPLNEFFVLSLTSVLGLVFAVRRWRRLGWQPLHQAAAVMLLVFAATAATRFPVSSYALSIGALGFAVLPLLTPATSDGEVRALVRGLMVGLWLTLALALTTILIQISGLVPLLGPVASLLVGAEQTGLFLGYIRPTAGFTEPSHLAIYLATVYVALDLLARAGLSPGRSRPFVALGVVFTGSVSGLVLFVAYLAAGWLGGLRRALFGRLSGAGLVRAAAVIGGLLLIAAYLLSTGPESDEYALRLIRALDDFQTGNLVGSEGSRVNAILALPAYWASAGLPGVLVGTGYANYGDWLIDTFGLLNVSATFSRGEVDSILVVVFLSTGLVGFTAYLVFLYRAFGHRVAMANLPVLVFVLTMNFSYGYLIAGLYWQLLFVLASTARCTTGRSRRPAATRPRVAQRRAAPVGA